VKLGKTIQALAAPIVRQPRQLGEGHTTGEIHSRPKRYAHENNRVGHIVKRRQAFICSDIDY
jgi:hypothetical protein